MSPGASVGAVMPVNARTQTNLVLAVRSNKQQTIPVASASSHDRIKGHHKALHEWHAGGSVLFDDLHLNLVPARMTSRGPIYKFVG